MKKWIALLLTFALCLSLAACAKEDDADSENCDHNYKKATCTSPAKCKDCGKTKGDPIEHKFIEGSDGFECKYCGKSKQELSKGKEKTIAVIAKGETHAFWQAVKAGAEAAGKEAGYKVTFRGPTAETEEYVGSQHAMVQAALNDKSTQAIVLATIGSGFGDMLTQAYDEAIPIVTIDSGLKDQNDITEGKNPIVAHVGFDNKASAAINAEKLFVAIKADIANATAAEPYVVGIIQHDQTQTGIDRAIGFEEKFKSLADADANIKGKYRIVKEIRDGDRNQAYVTALEALSTEGVKALFMTNEGVVRQVYDATKAASGRYDDIIFTGFDAGTKQVTWVAEGGTPALIGSVAHDSFGMGYQAVLQCIAAIEGGSPANTDIIGVWYERKNLKEMLEMDLAYTDRAEDKAALLSGTIVTMPNNSTENPEVTTPIGVIEKGEGKTSFNFEVTDIDGKTTKFLVKTDKTIVSDALLELGLIAGDPGPYGMYVSFVNGITADYDKDSSYWAFYINGEYAVKGVDQTKIDTTATYAFVKTQA